MIYKYKLSTAGQNSVVFEKLLKASFEKYFDGLFFYAHTILRDKEKAKDVVQGVYARWCETKKIPGDIQACKAYLYTAVYRRCLNDKRDTKPTVSLVHESIINRIVSPIADTYESEDLMEKIKEAIGSLPDQNKLVFTKSRIDEKSHKEIANDLKISVKTVENHINKSLKHLRKQLREYLQ